MSDVERPQIYLLSPPAFALDAFTGLLQRVLDASPVACFRLAMATRDEGDVCRAADALREILHARDIPIVIADHLLLAERLGLDGVHLSDGARRVRKAREKLQKDAIVGAFCGASRHDGLTAGEAGADYVSFGPVGPTALGDGTVAERELFAWWSEMIELPVVAEGGLTAEVVADLAPITDFFGIGEEIWSQDDPVAALVHLTQGL
ncbi:MAG: thiamine phosphate synthase [Alphaproteobacteria bacterium]|nr:MAG: thiamine phosphate synthase [Alphaproteobacteria bacterium]